MRPGLGATAGASGALDVLRYVSDDVKDAVKCVETEDASTRRADGVRRRRALRGGGGRRRRRASSGARTT